MTRVNPLPRTNTWLFQNNYLRRKTQKTKRDRSSTRNKVPSSLSEFFSDIHKSGGGLLIHGIQRFTHFTGMLNGLDPSLLNSLDQSIIGELLRFGKEFYSKIDFPIDIGDKLNVCNLDEDNNLIVFGELAYEKQLEMSRNIATVLISIALQFISGTDSDGKTFNGVSGSLENKRDLGQSF